MESPIDLVTSLVSQLPDPDDKGMLSDIDAKRVHELTSDLFKLGAAGLVALLDLLSRQAPGDDFKGRYALHCLALFACNDSDATLQEIFTLTLASQLQSKRPDHVLSYMIQELQAVGGFEVVPALGKVLLKETLCETAAEALTAIGGKNAAAQFRAALPSASGGCRLTIVQNLGVLRDAESIDLLKKATTDADAAIRQTALWALANIGAADAVDLVLKAADTSQNWDRIQATKTCLLLAERLMEQDKKNEAAKIYSQLKKTRTDASERYIQEAASRALASIQK